MWDTVSLGTMAAAYHSTRASFFRCLSLFRETGLLEPTPYNERSSLSLSLSISDIPFLEWLNCAPEFFNSSLIHADRKSTIMVSSFHLENVEEREKIGWTSIPFSRFAAVIDEGISRAGGA